MTGIFDVRRSILVKWDLKRSVCSHHSKSRKKQKDRIWIMDVKKKHLYNFNRMYPAKTNKIETPLGFYLKNNENYPTSYEHKFAR